MAEGDAVLHYAMRGRAWNVQPWYCLRWDVLSEHGKCGVCRTLHFQTCFLSQTAVTGADSLVQNAIQIDSSSRGITDISTIIQSVQGNYPVIHFLDPSQHSIWHGYSTGYSHGYLRMGIRLWILGYRNFRQARIIVHPLHVIPPFIQYPLVNIAIEFTFLLHVKIIDFNQLQVTWWSMAVNGLNECFLWKLPIDHWLSIEHS